jgi:hypothetical protein
MRRSTASCFASVLWAAQEKKEKTRRKQSAGALRRLVVCLRLPAAGACSAQLAVRPPSLEIARWRLKWQNLY